MTMRYENTPNHSHWEQFMLQYISMNTVIGYNRMVLVQYEKTIKY